MPKIGLLSYTHAPALAKKVELGSSTYVKYKCKSEFATPAARSVAVGTPLKQFPVAGKTKFEV
jgi:hypothetical protein